MITIYTDGACSGNPGIGGWGVVILAENKEDIIYTQENFGMRPGQYIEELGWLGNDVWHAHCVQLDQSEISLFANTGTGIAHCPCSNMRLASGIAPRLTLCKSIA